ncbi:MAG: dihydroneopterin aldolase, partial [Pseudomonadota bacterium]
GDDVDLILSYDRITEAIEGELSEERLNLLETLAARIADRILLEPQALRAFVRIEKLDRGPGTLGVEIARTKPSDQGVRALADTPEPIVLCLSNAAIASDHLVHWINAAEQHERPVIFCVGLSDVSGVQVEDHKMVQRRIDLLALEQNAWVLASKDDRCVVVATRTELDWGLRNDQIGVWASSKLVLDSVEGPGVPVTDTPRLVAWFAAEMNAAEVVFVGVAAPEDIQNARTAAIEDVGL